MSIEVDDHQIRIKGNKELLEKAVLASQNGQSWCSQTSTRWRARRDSNSQPRINRALREYVQGQASTSSPISRLEIGRIDTHKDYDKIDVKEVEHDG